MRRGGWAAWSAAGAVLAAHALAVASSPAGDHLADLAVYRAAVRGWLAGRDLYGYRAANGDPFTYPPVAALVLAPLAVLPEVVAQTLWTLLQLAAVVGLARLVARVAARPSWCPEGAWWPGLVVLLGVSAPVASSVHFGQVSLVLAAATAWAVLGSPRSRPWSVVAAGVAGAVKLTPLAVLPVVAARRWRHAALVGVTAVVVTLVTWLLLPRESWRYWTVELLAGRYGHASIPGNQSLAGFLARHPVLPPGAVGALLHGDVVVLVVGLGVWRAVRLARRGSMLPAYVVASSATAVVSPVTWTHHLVPLVLAAVCVTGKTVRRTWVLRAVIVGVMTVNLGSLPLPALQPVLVESRLLLALWLALVASYGRGAPSAERFDAQRGRGPIGAAGSRGARMQVEGRWMWRSGPPRPRRPAMDRPCGVGNGDGPAPGRPQDASSMMPVEAAKACACTRYAEASSHR